MLCNSITGFSETSYTKQQLENACDGLNEYCEIAKEKCALEKEARQEECLIGYFSNYLITSMKKQDPADLRNKKYANEACKELGEECVFLKLECKTSGSLLFYTCIANTYFELQVSKELCGKKKYRACFERNREFSVKIIHELVLPARDRALVKKAWKECDKAGAYKVKSDRLRRYYYNFTNVFKYIEEPFDLNDNSYEYIIKKTQYNCMRKFFERSDEEV